MTNKVTYTKVFLKALGKSTAESVVIEHMPLWWQNTRKKDSGGLRLTEAGYELLQELDIATYDIPYPRDMPLTTQVIIYLDRFIDCPYYLTNRSITVTNESKAVELALFSGDVRKYGINKALKRSKKDE